MAPPAVDLTDSRVFVKGVPHEWLAQLRRSAPVSWHEGGAAGSGFWAVTGYHECVRVNRDFEHFSSARQATYLWDVAPEDLASQQLMMLNMDPPLHTRYRRLVNKGFTPRMVAQLEEQIHVIADDLIDSVCERGEADFVTDLVAEMPLIVIAELLGVPQDDRHRVFEWSNKMIGSEDPEYQEGADAAGQAAMELYAYAEELFARKRVDPHADLMTALAEVSVDGEQLSELELDLFFLLLSVAGNETT
ncbi:MAG: cytochrome P450, partial [Actinomycetota bacterium]|nr:cytochrome P450 [Actinomycetota bacterium]